MIGHCLRLKATLINIPIRAQASRVCGLIPLYLPLYVDEGVLYVDVDGKAVKLYVDKT